MLESLQWQQSIDVQRDHDATSAFEKSTITELDAATTEPSTIDGPKGHPAFAFEEDLSKSWVYQRSLIRGPRTFSIATSKRLTQITQSWSILSRISLSQISNIAVQSLPIFQDDLKDNHLYAFGDVEYADHADHGSRIIPITRLFFFFLTRRLLFSGRDVATKTLIRAPLWPNQQLVATNQTKNLKRKGKCRRLMKNRPTSLNFCLKSWISPFNFQK